MAKNTGNGTRKGSVTNRSQVYNSKTGLFVKRDDSGKFMACKETPFKSVRKEKSAKEYDAKSKDAKALQDKQHKEL